MNGVETPTTTPKCSRRPSRFLLGSIALAFVGLMGACAIALSQLVIPDGDLNETPGIYKPIPVATSACPFLRRVHDTAARAGQQWVIAFGGFKELNRSDVKRALADFDDAVRRAMPRVPKAVSQQLALTLQQVRVGEREVLRAVTMLDYGLATFPAVGDGKQALGNASDLVGNACGFRLAPRVDYERALQPPSTSAPTL